MRLVCVVTDVLSCIHDSDHIVAVHCSVEMMKSSDTDTIDRQVTTCLFSTMADLFEALVAPARRAILDELYDRDGQTLFEICTRLTMKHNLSLTRQAISQHLEVLEAAGLVSSKREGRYKYHYLDTQPLKAIVKRWLKLGHNGEKT